MELTISNLNKMKTMGQREKVNDLLSILRVPGGHIYEYSNEHGEVTEAKFITKDELRSELPMFTS